MSFNFSDLNNKTFSRSMLGYDPYEVNTFLRNLSMDIEKLLKEKAILKDIIREKEVSLLNFKEKDKSLSDTLEVAKDLSKKLKTDTQRESKLIINDAEQKAELIIKDATDSLKQIYKDINKLRKSKVQIETNLRALLHAHLNLLDEQISDKTVNLIEDPIDEDGSDEAENISQRANKTSISPVST